EHDQLDVRDGSEGRDVQGDPPCDLGNDDSRVCVTFAGGAEDGARVFGTAENLRSQLRDLRSGRIDAVEGDQREVDLAGSAVAAAVELAAEDDARAHSGADREEDEVVHTTGDALPPFAQRGTVDVILEPDRQAERSLELARERPAVDAGDVLDDPHDARPALDYPGDADDDGIDAVGIESRRLRQRLAQALDRLDRLLRFGDLQLDILAGANLAGE